MRRGERRVWEVKTGVGSEVVRGDVNQLLGQIEVETRRAAKTRVYGCLLTPATTSKKAAADAAGDKIALLNHAAAAQRSGPGERASRRSVGAPLRPALVGPQQLGVGVHGHELIDGVCVQVSGLRDGATARQGAGAAVMADSPGVRVRAVPGLGEVAPVLVSEGGTAPENHGF